MKRKKLLFRSATLILCLNWGALQLLSHPKAATSGTTTFTVTTVSYGGNYEPKNAGVAWVADAQDKFVKTLKLWADKRKNHLIKWNAASNGNTVDAVTGATARTPQTHTVIWDGTNTSGAVVNDGIYKIYVEFTEDNSSSSGKPPGKWIAVEFTKGPTPQTLTPAEQAYFKAMKLEYQPDAGAPLPAAVAGKVTDANTAAALASVTVQLQSNAQTRYTATTNAGGLYELPSVDAGAYTLVASKSGYQNYSENITLTSGQQLVGKNIALPPVPAPASLSGKVTDAKSTAALVSATVQLQSNNQVRYSTTTDASGQYQIQNITAGTYTLFASKGGYQNQSSTLTLAAGQQLTGKNLALTPNVTNAAVSGTVRNANTNASIRTATVQLKNSGQVQYQTTTNTNGVYTLGAVQPATYTLVVLKDGFNSWTERLTLASGQNISGKDIALTPVINGASLSGTIFEAGSNQPLASATVQLKSGNQVKFETTTTASGAYAFTNVAEGSYNLSAFKNGYNLASQNISLTAGQNLTNRNLSLTKTTAPDTTPPPAPGNLSFEILRP